MRTNAEGAIVLSKVERRALAQFVAANALINLAEELDWESCPNLNAAGFEDLCVEIAVIGRKMIDKLGILHDLADHVHAKVTTP